MKGKKFKSMIACTVLSVIMSISPILYADEIKDVQNSNIENQDNKQEDIKDSVDSKEADSEGKDDPTTPIYKCDESGCCECSSVMSQVFDQIIVRNRFNPQNDNYDPKNFLDDVREGIHNAIKNGTEYDFELAKLEMTLLLTKYKDEEYAKEHPTIDMYVYEEGSWVEKKNVKWSPKVAVQAFINAYERKYDNGTVGKDTALQEAANTWNNKIGNYLKFPTEETVNGYGNKVESITMHTIAEVYKEIGISELEGKNLQEMKEAVGHVHNPSKEGIHDDCNCGHICSIKMQTMLNSKVNDKYIYIHEGNDVKGYDHYIEAKISTDKANLAGLLSDQIKIGVVNINTESDPFYIVGECVCRLGAEVIPKGITYTPEWVEVTNGIQPEGITNITTQFKLDKKMKDMSIEISLANLINDKMNCKIGESTSEQLFMDYDLLDGTNNKFWVEVKNITGATESTIESTSYEKIEATDTNSDSIYDTVSIKFKSDYYGEEGSQYKVLVYVPTTMKDYVQYGYLPKEIEGTGNSYLAQKKGQEVKAVATLKGRVRTGEEVTINGKTYPESYDAVIRIIGTDEIPLKYGAMATIY